MSDPSDIAGDNIIVFPRHRIRNGRPSDNSFLAEYERLVRAYQKIGNPKTRAKILELLKASGARLPWADSGH